MMCLLSPCGCQALVHVVVGMLSTCLCLVLFTVASAASVPPRYIAVGMLCHPALAKVNLHIHYVCDFYPRMCPCFVVQLHAPVSVDMHTGSTSLAPHSLPHTVTYIHTHCSYPSCIPHFLGQAVILVLRIAFIHQVGTEVVQCIDQNTGAAAVHSAKAHALVTPTHSFFAVGLAWHAWQLPMAVLAGGSVSSSSVQKLVRQQQFRNLSEMSTSQACTMKQAYLDTRLHLSGLHCYALLQESAYIAPY